MLLIKEARHLFYLQVLYDTKFWRHKILAILLVVQIWQILHWRMFVPHWIHAVQLANKNILTN